MSMHPWMLVRRFASRLRAIFKATELKSAPQTRHTVLLIHGTFANSKDGLTQWWQPGSAFCQDLDQRLAALGSPARCWAHDGIPFEWDGRNSWLSRTVAANRLARYIERLSRSGWVCHVIGHSHGGNVVLDAVVRITSEHYGGGFSDTKLGHVVTIGTPYIHDKRSVWQSAVAFDLQSVIQTLSSFVVLNLVYGGAAWILAPLTSFTNTILILSPLALVVVIVGRMFAQRSTLKKVSPILILGSQSDEVYQALTRMLAVKNNPLNPMPLLKVPMLALSQGKNQFYAIANAPVDMSWGMIVATFAVVLVTGRATAFLVMLTLGHFEGRYTEWRTLSMLALLPLWIGMCFGAYYAVRGVMDGIGIRLLAPIAFIVFWIRAALTQTAATIGQGIAWSVIRSTALGTGGSGLQLARLSVELVPQRFKPNQYCYEEMDHAIVEKVLRNQERQSLTTAQQILEQWRSPAFSMELLLRALPSAGEFALVHGAYYMSESCRETMAKWIAGTHPKIERMQKQSALSDGW